MNDELKATLEWLKECGENDYIFETGNSKMLLDYITNLQQKIKHYEETTTFGDYVKEVNLLVDYKSRIEKAVEYIKEHTFQEEIGFDNKKGEIHYGYFVECKAKELLDTLNGRSDE